VKSFRSMTSILFMHWLKLQGHTKMII